jgi:hypothetical protein
VNRSLFPLWGVIAATLWPSISFTAVFNYPFTLQARRKKEGVGTSFFAVLEKEGSGLQEPSCGSAWVIVSDYCFTISGRFSSDSKTKR